MRSSLQFSILLILCWSIFYLFTTFDAIHLGDARSSLPSVAIIYAFNAVSATHVANFKFFLKHGVSSHPDVDYYFVFNGNDSLASLLLRCESIKGVFFRENSCYDFGGWIYAIRSQWVHTRRSYSYFVFLNAGVRGPLLPASFPRSSHWHESFTSRLTAEVKLVGTTINCGGKSGVAHPHVQSMAWATDRAGLDIILLDEVAFRCFLDDDVDRTGLILRHELGISRAILQAGFNIDSLLRSTSGADYRSVQNWHCNGDEDPYSLKAQAKGNNLDLLFVKTNRGLFVPELEALTKELADGGPPSSSPNHSAAKHALADIADPRLDRSLLQEAARVDIIIVVHRAQPYLNQTLSSIFAHSDPDLLSRVILVDDGSDGQTLAFLSEAETLWADRILLLTDRTQRGYTYAVNDGLRTSTAEFIVLAGNDILVFSGWLRRLVDCALSDPRIGVVGPLSNAAGFQSIPNVFLPNSTQWYSNAVPSGWSSATIASLIEHTSPRSYPRLPLLNGFLMLIKRRVIRTVGLFDDALFGTGPGAEDDFCLRVGRAGIDLVVDDATYVHHFNSRSFGHDLRANLSTDASSQLRAKHGSDVVDQALQELKHSRQLEALRTTMRACLPYSSLFSRPFRILYLLPVESGQVSVVQESIALWKLGAGVKLALPAASRASFEQTFPDLTRFDISCTLTKQRLSSYAGLFHVVIATGYYSVKTVAEIHRRFPFALPAYYLQDYEPDLFPPNSSERAEAERSYGLVASWGGLLFADTRSLVDKMRQEQGVEVQKVQPMVAPLTRVRSKSHNLSRPVRLLALLRPSTTRPNAAWTLQVLAAIQASFPHAVEVVTFGCSQAELDRGMRALNLSFPFSHFGVLNASERGALLHRCDVFLDLSEREAFGRTAAEAMIHGCTAILPRTGGTAELAEDKVNALLVDPRDATAILSAVEAIVEDRAFLARLQKAASTLANTFSEREGAAERTALFQRAHRAWVARSRMRR